MKYIDGEVILRRREAKLRQSLDITKAVGIDGKQLTFREIRLYEGGLSVIVPEQFAEMTKEAAKLKYPSEHRPDVILSSADGTVNLAFTYREFRLTTQEIEDKAKEWRKVTKRVNPAFVFLSEKLCPLGESKLAYFDFKSYALDADIYSLIFITNLRENLLIGTFNCPFEKRKEWKVLATQMILSIRDLTRKKEGDSNGNAYVG